MLGHRRTRWPSAKGAHELAQAAHVAGAAPPPMAQRHAPAGAVVRPARRSTVRGACMPPERAPASPTGARTARERHRPEQPRASACCWYVLEGGMKPENSVFVPPAPPERCRARSNAQRDDPIPPNTPGSRVLERCTSLLAGYLPSRRSTGTTHDQPHQRVLPRQSGLSAKDPRHARPREVHVDVGWIPPLLNTPSKRYATACRAVQRLP